jgi:tight adherence protein B
VRAGRLANKRMRRFEGQFPEALELMTRALRSGHSITFAFQLVGEEMPSPIGLEFTQVSEEIKLGQELRVALSNLAYRINVGDLPYFITAVMIQRETGGNLAELLENLGYVMRDRLKLFEKVRSLTAVGKATANILGAWPLLMVGLLSFAGADFVSLLWENPVGRVLSLGATILVVVGYVLCRRAAEIRV